MIHLLLKTFNHGLENSGTVSYYLLIKVIWEIKGTHTCISTIFPGVGSIHVCVILSLTMDNGSWALKFFPCPQRSLSD